MLHHFAGSWKDIEGMTYIQRWLRRHLWARLAWPVSSPALPATEAPPTPFGHPVTVRVQLPQTLASSPGRAENWRALMLLVHPMAKRQGYTGTDAGASLSAWGAWQGGLPPGERPGLLDTQLGLVAAAAAVHAAKSGRDGSLADVGRFVELGGNLGLSSMAMWAPGVDALFLSAAGEGTAERVNASAVLSGLTERVTARAVLPGSLGTAAAAFLFDATRRHQQFRAIHFEGPRGLQALGTILELAVKDTSAPGGNVPFPLTGVTGLVSGTQPTPSVVSALSTLAAAGLRSMRHAGRACNTKWRHRVPPGASGALPDLPLAYAEDVDAWAREHAVDTQALVARLSGQPWPHVARGSAPPVWCEIDSSREGIEAFAQSLARVPDGFPEAFVAS